MDMCEECSVKNQVSELEGKVRSREVSLMFFVLGEKYYFISSNIRKIEGEGRARGIAERSSVDK